MKIAFHTNQLSLRGTEVSMYDYAHYNEKLLGNKSIIVSKHPDIQKFTEPLAVAKFKKRFDVFFYKTVEELQSILKSNKVDVFYAQKAGAIDEIVSNSCKTVVHAVFQYEEPHGNVYAYISEWLSQQFGNRHPFVPYMVELPNENGNLRKQLGIPDGAYVFGRHGGMETFDIGFVHNTVNRLAHINPNIYFLFMNTYQFMEPRQNVIFLEGNSDMVYKTKFINTCDAMLHARMNGESFGLAVAEFSIRNKPVITCQYSRDTAHIKMLGNKGIYYQDEVSLMKILRQQYDKNADWNAYRDYTPVKVMEKFRNVFLK
jgi:hypothetical protein